MHVPFSAFCVGVDVNTTKYIGLLHLINHGSNDYGVMLSTWNVIAHFASLTISQLAHRSLSPFVPTFPDMQTNFQERQTSDMTQCRQAEDKLFNHSWQLHIPMWHERWTTNWNDSLRVLLANPVACDQTEWQLWRIQQILALWPISCLNGTYASC